MSVQALDRLACEPPVTVDARSLSVAHFWVAAAEYCGGYTAGNGTVGFDVDKTSDRIAALACALWRQAQTTWTTHEEETHGS